jgi:hypothetical protein
LAVLLVTSTAVFPASSAVEGAQSEFLCLFASGVASGSERLRLPPQIRPQPTHPVRQRITWHPEVNCDVGVVPAVYDPALQQPAVVVGQIPEEGAKPIRGIMHRGDLGGHVASVSVVRADRRSPGRWPPVLLSPPDPSRSPKYPGIRPSPRERPGNTKTGHLLGRSHFPDRGWGIPWTPVWLGVGIYRRGMWIYLLSLLRPRGQRRCGRRCAVGHRARGVGRVGVAGEHCARDGLGDAHDHLVARADGSEAARSRRNRRTAVRGRREAPEGRRTASQGCRGLAIGIASVIATIDLIPSDS